MAVTDMVSPFSVTNTRDPTGDSSMEGHPITNGRTDMTPSAGIYPTVSLGLGTSSSLTPEVRNNIKYKSPICLGNV